MWYYQNPKVGPSFMATPIKQLKQPQTTTPLLSPFHFVNALSAGKKIYLNTGHRRLKENLPATKHATAFTCYVCKKGLSSNKNRYTGKRVQGTHLV